MSGCPCDVFDFPPKPDIPAGLDRLPRQLAGFPEYRLAMLRDIPLKPALRHWRAREGDDLGLMMLEWWAYVLDILGFYDERIANESYLRTAVRRESLRRLVGLIGYQPRPALASFVTLAAIAEGAEAVTLPAFTRFRSEAFDDEPPHIFESDVATAISRLTNEWTLGPVRQETQDGALLLEPGTARLTRDQLVLFDWPAGRHGARVFAAEAVEALDGATYIKLDIAPAPALSGVALEEISISSPSLTAGANKIAPGAATGSGETTLTLDAVYPQLTAGMPVILRLADDFEAAEISTVATVVVTSSTTSLPDFPATQITLDTEVDPDWVDATNAPRLVVHFNMVDGGRLTRVAEIEIEADELLGDVALDGLAEPLEQPPPSQLFLHDAKDRGELVSGSLQIADDGAATFKVNANPKLFAVPLRTPVRLLGNLVPATRGESVVGEVLGSGDASQTFQSFTLAKSPLTYLNDPSAANGRRGTLSVQVNAVQWKEVPSFFGTGAEDQVYIVRHDDEGGTTVTFGDGSFGTRLPSGVDNVAATYRFGAGAAKPPANTISQIARPVKGLRRILNPVAAAGGDDADKPQDIRTNAPDSALTLGRAISLPDFEALAREFGGVISAHATWSWDEAFQRAVVKVWFISDGGDIAEDLRAFLIGQSDPNTPLQAVEANPIDSTLILDLEIAEGHNPDVVAQAMIAALTDSAGGLLALENIAIGCPIFRSQILAQAMSVDGLASVRSMTIDGDPAPVVIETPEGHYRNFLPFTNG